MNVAKTGTRILFTGQYAAGTNSLYLAQAFQQCGATIRFLNDIAIFPYWNTLGGRILRRLQLPVILREWNVRLLQEVDRFKPDLVYVTDGHLAYQETIQKIRDRGVPIMCFYHDVHWKNRQYSRFDRCLDLFDLVATTRQWHEAEFKMAGAKHVMVVRFGYNPQVHHPVISNERIRQVYGSEVCFIGTKEAQRVLDLTRLVSGDFPYDFKIWGSLWNTLPDTSPILRYWQGMTALEDEIALIYATNKIALHWVGWDPNSSNEQLRKGDQHNSRTFQIAACNGAMMMAQRTDEHRAFFVEDQEAVFFDTPDELLEKLAYWMVPERDDARRQIAQAAYARCMQEDYSYVPVVKRFLTHFQLA